MGNCFTNKHSDRSTKNVNKPTHVGSEDINFSILLANEAVKIEEDAVAQPGFSNEMQQKINKFFKDSKEIADWINTQLFVAASEDYGKDLDDVDGSFLADCPAAIRCSGSYRKSETTSPF